MTEANQWNVSPQAQELILSNRDLRHCRIYLLFTLDKDFVPSEPGYLKQLLSEKDILLAGRFCSIQFYPFRVAQLREYQQPFVILSAVVPEPWIISHTYNQVLRNNLLPSVCIEQAHIWGGKSQIESIKNSLFEKWRSQKLLNIGRVDHFEGNLASACAEDIVEYRLPHFERVLY